MNKRAPAPAIGHPHDLCKCGDLRSEHEQVKPNGRGGFDRGSGCTKFDLALAARVKAPANG